MPELWQRTLALTRRHPILWLPYVVARLSAYCLTWLQRIAGKEIFVRFETSRSVLSDGLYSNGLQQEAMAKASMVTIPLLAGRNFVNIWLFTCAMVVTALFADAIRRRQKPDPVRSLTALVSLLKSVFWFSLKFLVLFGVIIGLIFTSASFILVSVLHSGFATSPILSVLEATLASTVVAWFLVPAAIRLLQPVNLETVSPRSRKAGTVVAIFVAAASNVLWYFYHGAETAFPFTPVVQSRIIGVLAALVIDSPHLLLFVALFLLASSETPANSLAGTSETGSLPQDETLRRVSGNPQPSAQVERERGLAVRHKIPACSAQDAATA